MKSLRSRRFTEEQKNILINYIKAHPESTYQQFVKDIKGKISCSDTHFSHLRREHGGISSRMSKGHRNTLYNTMWSLPLAEMEKMDVKDVLKHFLENGLQRRGRFQLIELKDPACIEIRETTR